MSRNYAEQYEYNGYLIRICWDANPESPREWSNLGRMICWHRRYTLGDRGRGQRHPETHDGTVCYDPSDFQEWWAENGKGGVILPLYLYDHSGITMSCGPFSCPWDSGQVGHIYSTREMILKEYGGKRITAKMRQQVESALRAEVSAYDEYLTGQVYGYEVYELESAGDEDDSLEDREGQFVDSCWGFYGGIDYCKQEAQSVVDNAAKQAHYSI